MSESVRFLPHSCMRHRAVWQVVNNSLYRAEVQTATACCSETAGPSTRQRDVTVQRAVTDMLAVTCYTSTAALSVLLDNPCESLHKKYPKRHSRLDDTPQGYVRSIRQT